MKVNKLKLAIAVQRFFGTIALSSLATDYKWVSTACIIATAAASEYINYISPGSKKPVSINKAAIMWGVVIISSLIMLSSCGRKQMPTSTKTDSTYVKVVKKDSIYYLPGDTVTNTIIVDCPEKGKPVIKSATNKKTGTGNRSTVNTQVDGNKITTTCECAEEKARIQWLETHTTRQQKEVITQPPKTIEKTPWWNWFVIGSLVTLIILMRIKKVI